MISRTCIALLAVILLAGGALLAQTTVLVGDGADDDRAYLGIQIREATELDEGGARITHIVDGSPADEAGLRVKDVVVEFAGKVVRGPAALTERIHAASPGEVVGVTVLRGGERKSFDVELAGRSSRFTVIENLFDSADGGSEADAPRWLELRTPRYNVDVAPDIFFNWQGRPKLGVQLVETTSELREHLGGSEHAGVLVSKVLAGMPAESAGIQVGDLILSVDGHEVASSAELVDALKGMVGETFEVKLMRDGRARTVEVSIPEPDVDRPSGPRAGLFRPLAPPRPATPLASPSPAAAPSAPTPPRLAAPQALPSLPAPPRPTAPSAPFGSERNTV